MTVREMFRNPEGISEQVVVSGWLRSVRDSKRFAFFELNDGSTVASVQVVLDENLPGFERWVKLNVGAAVVVTGRVVLTPEARQPFEIKAETVEAAASSTPDYPLQKKRHSMEFLRTLTHLRPRTNTFHSVFRIRSEAAFAIHDFFHSEGFVLAHTPLITGSDAEGAGEMFRVTTLPDRDPPLNATGQVDYGADFFGKPTHLTVSGQLEAEAFALAFGKTYTFGPTFRAEHSNTPRHAAEFWMIEPEMAFADLNDDMLLAERMVKHVVGHVFDSCPAELEFLNSRIDNGLLARLAALRDAPFESMTYSEAILTLEKCREPFDYPVSWGCDLQTEHERYLTEQVVGRPVFVTDYPAALKAFYMRLSDDGRTVAAMDLLTPGTGELIGGSQREERLDVLTERMRAHKLEPESYGWYLDLRRYGGVKHAGFGLGFERMVMVLTGMSNIRDVLPFPRTVGTCGI